MNANTETTPQIQRTEEANSSAGPIARHLKNGVNAFYYILAIFVVCVALAMKAFGVVALAMAALLFVPVILFLMVYGTFG